MTWQSGRARFSAAPDIVSGVDTHSHLYPDGLAVHGINRSYHPAACYRTGEEAESPPAVRAMLQARIERSRLALARLKLDEDLARMAAQAEIDEEADTPCPC